ncbi:MAG TPA: cupin domain-containing protein [Opitutaceae bacterium]|jgi:uncharacterized cupin superfamily protein
MKKINSKTMPEEPWTSRKGKYGSADRNLSVALGRNPGSPSFADRQPFDVEICRIPAGKRACPYHSHSAQWEFYHVISGRGCVRDQDGTTPVEDGDAFIFEPGAPHQLINDSDADLVLYIVADNPIGESCHYPDSKKWLVRSPERALIRSEPLDYLDGEE